MPQVRSRRRLTFPVIVRRDHRRGDVGHGCRYEWQYGGFREYEEWRVPPRDPSGGPHGHRARRVSYVKDAG